MYIFTRQPTPNFLGQRPTATIISHRSSRTNRRNPEVSGVAVGRVARGRTSRSSRNYVGVAEPYFRDENSARLFLDGLPVKSVRNTRNSAPREFAIYEITRRPLKFSPPNLRPCLVFVHATELYGKIDEHFIRNMRVRCTFTAFYLGRQGRHRDF